VPGGGKWVETSIGDKLKIAMFLYENTPRVQVQAEFRRVAEAAGWTVTQGSTTNSRDVKRGSDKATFMFGEKSGPNATLILFSTNMQ
jgi:hypothetical protein